jgi:orotidine-5'-phosphate decarboxylase
MELCIALDLPTKNENLELVNKLKKYDNIWLKVGLRTFIRDGEDFLKAIKAINPNFKIFLDLKLYDIPNTMADAAESIINLDIDMFNIHASAGKVAMQTVMDRVNKYKKRPIVLAVTALTSFSNDEFIDIYNQTIDTKANQFAKDAMDSGLDGVVCSAYESLSIKNITNNNFLTLSPGIRPFGEDTDDQKRVADIEFAYKNLVDFIVVGRPIYKADDPSKVVEQILNKIKDNIS